jgi:proteasome lid subunit RPN8/RPN11
MGGTSRGDSQARSTPIHISAGTLLVLRHHVESLYPEEACGGLLGSGAGSENLTAREATPLANAQVAERRRRYLLEPEDVLRLERCAETAGLQVVGFYHSHPDAAARPSAFDLEHAWPWYIYLIVQVDEGRAGEMSAWRLADDRGSFESVVISGGAI